MFEVCLLCCMVHVCCMLYVTCCTMAHDGAWWVLHTGDVLYLCCMYTVCMWHACMLHVCCICVAFHIPANVVWCLCAARKVHVQNMYSV